MIQGNDRSILTTVFGKAQKDFQEKKYAKAIERYQAAICIDPAAMAPYSCIGVTFFEKNKSVWGSIDNLERAIILHPTDSSSLFNLLSIEFLNRRYAQAASAAERILKLNSEDVNSKRDYIEFLHAISLYVTGSLGQAKSIFEKLIETLTKAGKENDSIIQKSWFFLGRIAYDREDFETVISSMKKIASSSEGVFCRQFINQAAFRSGKDSVGYAFNSEFGHQKIEACKANLDRGDLNSANQDLMQAIITIPWSRYVDKIAEEFRERAYFRCLDTVGDSLESNHFWRIMNATRTEMAYAKASLKTHSYGKRKRRIYDCFIFNDELDILEYRFEEMYSHVDYFVIVEAPWNFRGKEKPATFLDNQERFRKYEDKIIHIVSEYFCHGVGWDQEDFQRNQIMQGLIGCSDDDMIIITDCDEITRTSLLRNFREPINENDNLKVLSFRYYQLFLNAEGPFMWERPVVLPYGLLKSLGPNIARSLAVRPGIMPYKVDYDAGWHFSASGGMNMYLKKFHEGVHIEYTETQQAKSNIEIAFTQGKFQGDIERFKVVPIDSSFPKFVHNHLDDLKKKKWIF